MQGYRDTYTLDLQDPALPPNVSTGSTWQSVAVHRLIVNRRRRLLLLLVAGSVLIATSIAIASPVIALVAWAGLVVVVLAVVAPRLAFFGLLLITPLDLHLQSAFVVNSIMPPLHFLVATCVLARRRLPGDRKWLREQWSILAYAGVVAASIGYAFLDPSLGVPYDSFRFAYELASYVALALAACQIIRSTRDLAVVYGILLIGLIATDLYAVYQALVHDYGPIYRWLYPLSSGLPWQDRPPGLLNAPNNQSSYINLILPIVLAFAMFKRSVPTLLGAFAGVGLSLPALYLTQSRGAWVAIAVMVTLLVTASATPLLRAPVAIVGIIAAIGAAMFVPGVAARLQDYDASLYSRLDLWNVFWSLFITHPALGVGYGSFGVYYARAMDIVILPGTSLLHAHDFYLQLLAETGVVGFAAAIVLVLRSIRNSWWLSRIALPTGQLTAASFFLGTSVSLAGFLVHGFVDVVWYSAQFATVFWIFLALSSASHLRRELVQVGNRETAVGTRTRS